MYHFRRLTIAGNPYHVRMVGELVSEYLRVAGYGEEPRAYYHIGGWLSPRRLKTWVHAMRGDTVVHWIGSDVLELVLGQSCTNQGIVFRRAKRAVRALLLRRSSHLAGAPWLAEELRAAGVPAAYVPLPVRLPDCSSWPLPQNASVVSYIPEGKEAFYGWNEILSVAKLYPSVQWHIVAHSGRGLEAPANVVFHGYVPRARVLELVGRSSAVVRLVDHDGLSYSVLEALALGRYVIWSYPFPYCIKSTKDAASLAKAIDEVLGVRQPNEAGAAYVRETFDPSHTVRRLVHALRNRRV